MEGMCESHLEEKPAQQITRNVSEVTVVLTLLMQFGILTSLEAFQLFQYYRILSTL